MANEQITYHQDGDSWTCKIDGVTQVITAEDVADLDPPAADRLVGQERRFVSEEAAQRWATSDRLKPRAPLPDRPFSGWFEVMGSDIDLRPATYLEDPVISPNSVTDTDPLTFDRLVNEATAEPAE